MSAIVQQSTTGTAPSDSADIVPTTMASEATADPIQPRGTDALMPESRPETTTTTETTCAVPVTETPAKEQNASMMESQPLAEGVLGYKAPGLVKYVSIKGQPKFGLY